jgi:hypothetical protein
MKIMLDCSPDKIARYTERYDGYEFWQLRTPLTNYRLAGVPYGIDNGCFTKFDQRAFCKLVGDADRDNSGLLQWIVCPDMVGDAQRTRELYDHFARKHLRGLPIAYVLQDGVQNTRIPFDDNLRCLFVGGSTPFKTSDACLNAVRTAKMIDPTIKIHIGRVNSWDRADWWIRAGELYGFTVDSVDGSGMSRFDDRLETVLSAIRDDHPQTELEI